MVDDLVVGAEHPVRQPVVTHELPHLLLRVELRTFRRDRDDRDVGGQLQLRRQVPAGLIHEQHGVGAGSDVQGDLCQVQDHGVGVAERQNEAGRLALLRAYRAEDVCGFGALIVRCRGSRSPLRPSPRDLVLLADPGLVLEPDLYRCAARKGRSDFVQLGGKAPFLKASIASGSWAWCLGRAESFR